MSEKDRANMYALDEAAERAGGFVSSNVDIRTEYDYRKILKYCKEKGIEPVDMTISEFNSFIVQ